MGLPGFANTKTVAKTLALDALQANVMVADANLNITYMNPAVMELLKEAESDLKKELPKFSVASLIGSNIDVFHKNPSHQRNMLAALKNRHSATITGATSPVSPMEVHEMTMRDGQMVMQAKEGGVVVKARSEYRLEPGGDHLMLMNLAQPVRAGDEVSFTLTFADGRTQTFIAVAKPFTGAQESYAPGHGEPSHAPSASHSSAP